WFVFLIVLFVTAAGNIINDYYDAEIDAINKPKRPIPSGAITKRQALVYAAVLFVAGNLLAFACAPLSLTLIAVFNSILLWLYAAYLKTTPLFGNISVAYLASSVFLFGGAFQGTEGILSTLPIAGATFGVMFTRELVKDGEDIPGDLAHGARTFPILYGIRPTLILAFVSAVGGICVSLLLAGRWGLPYLAVITPVDLVILAGALRGLGCRDAEEVERSKSSMILKIGMFASLLVFLGSALLL
ncbi:MAG: UbiA family prenyltransferase, partial [Methanospirillum sp.]|nr:UbiA family prenyltransferase [Methanospirillum sp.]